MGAHTVFRAFAALLLAALATQAAPAVAADSVNIYTARHYGTDADLYELFTEKTGIEVNVVKGGSDFLVERIRTEGRNTFADILITVDAGRLWRAEQAGILGETASPALASAVPPNLRHPDGLWFGLTHRARIVAYAKDRVDPAALSTYEDLATDTWRGRLCIRSSNNIYNQSLLASLIAADGAEAAERWAAGIVANMARPPQGGDTDQVEAVVAGECDVAVVNHYYVVRMLEADPTLADEVGVYFPNQQGRGTHVNVSGAGITRYAPHPQAAVRFLEFLVTPAAQRIFANGNNEYPVVDGVDKTPILADWGAFKIDPVNVSVLGENNPAAVEIMDRVGWR